MKKKIYIISAISAFVLTGLITSIVVRSQIQTNKKLGTENIKNLPIVVKQLTQLNGVIPVTLTCEDANLIETNKLDKINCLVLNNTRKKITAFVVNFSIDTEIDDVSTKIDGAISTEMLFDQSLLDIRKESFIEPNGSSQVFLMPHTLDENQIIKSISMNIDYIEFEDQTSLGENNGGASLISEIRNGAMKYRMWISRKYKNINKSNSEINKMLQDKSFLQDSELNSLTPNQSQGLRLFRIFLQKTYETKGKPFFEKCLGNN